MLSFYVFSTVTAIYLSLPILYYYYTSSTSPPTGRYKQWTIIAPSKTKFQLYHVIALPEAPPPQKKKQK